MKYCPNSQCPHRVGTGESATYEGAVTQCSDCQSALLDGAEPPAPVTSAKAPWSVVLRPLTVTVGGAALWSVLSRLPAPGLSDLTDEMGVPIGETSFELLGRPLLFLSSAASVLGMLWLWRADASPRAMAARLTRGWRWILGIAVVNAIFSALSTEMYLQGRASFIDSGPRWVFHGGLALGLALLLTLMHAMRRHGLLSAFLALFAFESLREFFTTLGAVPSMWSEGTLTPFVSVGWAALLVASVFVTLRALDMGAGMRGEGGREAPGEVYRQSLHTPLRLTPGFRGPLAGVSMMGLSVYVLSLFRWLGLIDSTSSHATRAFAIAVSLGLYAALALFTHRPAQIVARMQRFTPDADPETQLREVLAARREALKRSLLFALALIGLETASQTLAPNLAPFQMSAALLVGAVLEGRRAADALREGRAMVTVSREPRVWAADLSRAVLVARGIPAELRGDRALTLMVLVGYLIPVEVVVPAEYAVQARALLADEIIQ